jgi:hypothetical protein
MNLKTKIFNNRYFFIMLRTFGLLAPNDFKIIYIFSFSCQWGTKFLHSREPSGKWLKLLISLSRVEKYRNPHGQLKENLFLPLFNTNFISKSEINAFEINAGKDTRHFNPLEDYRFFHHWFSGVKTP